MVQWRLVLCAGVFLSVLLVFSAAPVAGAGSAAEELTKRLPDDVIGFVATSGGDVLKGDFEKTALGRIWNDQGVRSFCQSIRTALLAKAQQEGEDPNLPKKIDLVLNYARLVLSRPTALGIAQVEPKEGLPPVCVFAILEAGGRKAELTEAVSKLEAMVEAGAIVDTEVGSRKMHSVKGKEQVYWGWVDDYLILAANDARGAAAKYLGSPRTTVPVSLGKLPAHGDALVVYYDYQKLWSLLGTLVREEDGEKKANQVLAFLKGLGFADLKTLTARVGFAESNVASHVILELPTPATGMFTAFKPVDPAWFRAVDVRAVTATAINWDIAGLYDTVMNTLKTALPEEIYPAAQKAIADIESEIKVRIRDDLLASLAGPAVFYSLPAGAMLEAPRGGFVAVAKLRNVELFEKTMTALGEFAGERGKDTLQIDSRSRDDGRTVHVWAIAPLAMLGVMPSWSVANDHVVIGSNTELCDLGVKQLVSKDAETKSLLDAPGYQKVAAELPKNLISLSYTDAQVQLNQTMMQLQQVWPMLTMVAMQAGIKLPVMLPSLTEIAKDVQPSCCYRYWGPDGIHLDYRGPGVETGPMVVVGAGLGAGVMMPALARAREQARNVASMSNLKQIGLALIMYADEHQGNLPVRLEDAKSYYGSAKILESPHKPKDFSGPSYLYISGQTTAADYHNIVAYENPEFCKDKINVLFLDGHVEAMTPEAFQRELQATYERLGRKMPDAGSPDGVETKLRTARPVEASKEQDTCVSVTEARRKVLHKAINEFHMDTGQWPTEDEGLMPLLKQPTDVTNWRPGGYLKSRELLKDGWGRDFIYEPHPESGKPFVIRSLGRDGREGGSGYDADLPTAEPPVSTFDPPTE